ncbi:MAG: AAA family ATPase [Desulfobacteraceae bacterium]
MYTSFYQLNKKPFEISSDPSFMWFGEKHKEALATLRYGILNNKGFLLLTGDVGTGKTTLINALLKKLSRNVICISVSDPNLETLDFINYIASCFGMKKEFSSKGQFLIEFRKFLLKSHQAGKKVLMIIDEAQLLTDDLLEQIRLLSNIDMAETKLLNIFFVGQNEFNHILLKTNNRAVRQRITLNYNIDPFTPDETGTYIRHRLKIAGAVKDIFTSKAVQKIHLYSGGFPRRINIICDHCLLSGYVNDKRIIDESIVTECSRELEIPQEVQKRDLNSFNEVRQPPETNFQQKPVKNKTGMKVIFAVILSAVLILTGLGLYQPRLYDKGIQITDQYYSQLEKEILDFFDNNGPSVQAEQHQESVEKQIREIKHTADPEIDTAGDFSETEPSKGKRDLHADNYQIPGSEPESLKPDYLTLNQVNDDKENDGKGAEEPLKEISPLKKKKLILRFKNNSNEFSEKGEKEINKFADKLLQYPDLDIIVTGYTDSAGYPKYNVKLSEFRANIVKSYLMGKGIDGGRIHARGVGSENSVESNDTAWGRKMNRRVELNVYQNDK